MKTATTWQRLNTAFWLLIVVLLAGVALALWAANARSDADRRSEQLGAARANIASWLRVALVRSSTAPSCVIHQLWQ